MSRQLVLHTLNPDSATTEFADTPLLVNWRAGGVSLRIGSKTGDSRPPLAELVCLHLEMNWG